jgi:hypothetical protein
VDLAEAESISDQPCGLPTARPRSVPEPVKGEIVAPSSATFVCVSFGPKELTPAVTMWPRKNVAPT